MAAKASSANLERVLVAGRTALLTGSGALTDSAIATTQDPDSLLRSFTRIGYLLVF